MATYKPYRKISSTEKEEIRIPYSVLVDTPNLDEYTKNAAKTYVYYVTGDGDHAGYDIEHPLGADVNVSVYLVGQSIFGETMDELVMVDVYTKLKGVKLVFASAPSSDMKFKVVITGVEPEKIGTLEETSWEKIRKIVLAGKATNYWSVGDTKTITSKSGKAYTIRLVDLQDGRYKYSNGIGSSKAVFEFVECYDLDGITGWQINSSNDSTGGWAECEMKTQTMPTLLTDLPDDMVAAMSQVKVLSGIGGGSSSGTSSSDNKLFLHARAELIHASLVSTYLAESPLGQFDYYRLNDTDEARTKHIVDKINNVALWLLRSPVYSSSNSWCVVNGGNPGGTITNGIDTILPIAPIFAI